MQTLTHKLRTQRRDRICRVPSDACAMSSISCLKPSENQDSHVNHWKQVPNSVSHLTSVSKSIFHQLMQPLGFHYLKVLRSTLKKNQNKTKAKTKPNLKNLNRFQEGKTLPIVYYFLPSIRKVLLGDIMPEEPVPAVF